MSFPRCSASVHCLHFPEGAWYIKLDYLFRWLASPIRIGNGSNPIIAAFLEVLCIPRMTASTWGVPNAIKDKTRPVELAGEWPLSAYDSARIACSKTVVVPCSERIRLGQIGAISLSGSALKNIVE